MKRVFFLLNAEKLYTIKMYGENNINMEFVAGKKTYIKLV
jgi:hypothetical protein